MKKFLLLFLVPFIFSCSSYYPAQLISATPIYHKQTSPDSFDTIPAGSQVMVKGKKATKYRMVSYKSAKGYAVNPDIKGADAKGNLNPEAGKTSNSKKKG